METKEFVMLGVMLLLAVVGSTYLIYLLGSLDGDDDGSKPNDHGHGGGH